MEDSQVKRVIDNTLSKLRELVDSDCIVGKEIETKVGTVIPICKATVGFVSGGGEYNNSKKIREYPFAGGSSAGCSLVPIGFLVVGKKIEFIKVASDNTFDRLCDFATKICDEIKG